MEEDMEQRAGADPGEGAAPPTAGRLMMYPPSIPAQPHSDRLLLADNSAFGKSQVGEQVLLTSPKF